MKGIRLVQGTLCRLGRTALLILALTTYLSVHSISALCELEVVRGSHIDIVRYLDSARNVRSARAEPRIYETRLLGLGRRFRLQIQAVNVSSRRTT